MAKNRNTSKPKSTPTPEPQAPQNTGTAPETTSVEPGGNPKTVDPKLDPNVGTPIEHSLKEPVVTTPELEQEQAKIPQENLRMPDGSKPITAKDFEIARGQIKT